MNDELIIEVGLPDPCLSPNGPRSHWGKVYAAKKSLREAVYNTVRICHPMLVNANWKAAQIKYDFYHEVHRTRDDDNFRSMMKSGRDALGPPHKGRKKVHPGASVVVNDTAISDTLPVGFHIDKNNPRVKITLRRVK